MDATTTPNPQANLESPWKKWIWRLSIAAGAVLSAVIASFVWADVKRNAVMVEPFAVPEQYAKDGYSNEVITRRIIEEVGRAEGSVKSRSHIANEVFVLTTEKDILTDFEIPSSKLSVRTAVTAIRKLIGADQRSVSGDIVFSNQCTPKKDLVSHSHTPVVITVRMSPEPGYAAPNTKCVSDGGNEESVIESASEAILENLQPLVLAAYLGLTKREYARSIELADKLISQANPNEHDTLSNYYNLRGAIYLAHGYDDRALADFGEAIKHNPLMAGAYNNSGLVFVQQRKYIEAIASFRKSIAIDRDNPQAYSNLGLALYRFDENTNLQEAKADFQKAVRLDKTFSKAYFNWGVVLLDEADTEENSAARDVILNDAVSKFTQAEEFGLTDGNLFFLWGEALQSLGRTQNAMTQFQRADAQGFRNAALYKAWGDALLDGKHYSDAVARYRQATELEPRDYDSFNRLGMALYDLRKLEEAQRSYDKAIRLNPKSPEAHYNVGIVLADEGKLDGAKDQFRQAIALDGSFADAYVRLGRVLSEQSRCDEAVATFGKALQLEPDNSDASNYSKQSKLRCAPRKP